MDKAFDLVALKEKVRAKGGPSAEENLEKTLEAIQEWLVESAAASPSALVKAAVPLVLSVVVLMAKPIVDQIDGQPG